jgi:hypothetical protein
MYDRYMFADSRCFSAPRLEVMPLGLTPTARTLLLALWLCEATGEHATKDHLLELVGCNYWSFHRAWKSLHERHLIRRV